MGRQAAPASAPAPPLDKPAAHVVLLASPGAGHILPMAELARRVVTHGAVPSSRTATLITYTNFSAAEHSFTALPPYVSTVVLPEVPLDDLPADARVETRILTVIRRALPHIHDLLCSLLAIHDLVGPVQDRTNPVYSLVVELENKCLLADGFIVNTFDAIEHETIAAFNVLSQRGVYPPAYAVGPFVRTCSGGSGEAAAEHRCLRWLDEQPERSVLYVCFGSGGTLSAEQMAELAAGLEASGKRFLWVVRFPSDKDRCASFFGGGHGDQWRSHVQPPGSDDTDDSAVIRDSERFFAVYDPTPL